MIEIKIRVNVKNKGEKDKGFSGSFVGGLKPCQELLDFAKEFMQKNLKQDILNVENTKSERQ